MGNLLDELEPKLLWQHFFALAAIPRCSKHEEKVAAHIRDLAKNWGMEVKQDSVGNIIVSKPATPGLEDLPVTVLQGHIDMVCEKNEDTQFDFSKDPIRIIRKDDFITANGTTLGADNGIGVAAALAILESKDISHGPLEALFTIDEETGLTGAFNLEKGILKASRMLNLDSEEEGAIYIGCAGGLDTLATRSITRTNVERGKKAYRIKLSGLKGGHSGLEINQGRGNAIQLLSRAIHKLAVEYKMDLVSINGGNKHNAIPREAVAIVYLKTDTENKVREELKQLQNDIRSELGNKDPLGTFSMEQVSDADEKIITSDEARRLINFLYAAPHGVLAMSPDIDDLVQTSTNLAIVETKENEIKIHMSHRSSVASSINDVANKVDAFCELAGYKSEHGSGYPGWKPNIKSSLLALAKDIHKKLFGYEPAVKAIHAGLECGIITEKYPGMDVISFGPTILGAHSPDERVSIKSVKNFWTFLLELIKTN